MEKRWVIKKVADNKIIEPLSKALNINHKLANLLAQRGIKSYQTAKSFFRPEISKLHDPFLMKGMDKAINRLEKAREKGEKILVYGDYDVDGTTAVSIVYSFLKGTHKLVDFYIPDRYNEGYGISFKGIDYAVSEGHTLMISLDCGIKAVEKVEYANKKGLDIIICDHHRPGDKIPEAIAVLDPKQNDCNYPFKELSGAGVGFKLIQALAARFEMPPETTYAFLDLVAISIAADMVAIVGENRTLSYFGLENLNMSPRIGITYLLNSAGIKKRTSLGPTHYFDRKITITDLVFLIGPKINAAGRIDSATDSVRLLISNNKGHTIRLGNQINELNLTRRKLDTNITREALQMLANRENGNGVSKKASIVYNANWHKGVVGIVASRLIDNYYRPTVVLTRADGLITGSARSVKGFDVYNAIESTSHLLENFGGHTYAAGMSLKPENLESFITEFNKYTEENITQEMLIPEIEIDTELFISDINYKFYKILRQFAPFGPGNMSPVFLTKNVIDTGYVKLVGKNDESKHLKFSAVHPDRTGNPVPSIAFNQARHFKKMKEGKIFDICYHIEENFWLGNTTLQLRVLDIKFHD
ncbi:MAG: single-stranded-DNA-specific exonuclease RecJ [Bacteroidetes bacterium]|nr:single-stranded-DNA-specific exonuclease RecJ [Bacteroidota bacterium]